MYLVSFIQINVVDSSRRLELAPDLLVCDFTSPSSSFLELRRRESNKDWEEVRRQNVSFNYRVLKCISIHHIQVKVLPKIFPEDWRSISQQFRKVFGKERRIRKVWQALKDKLGMTSNSDWATTAPRSVPRR